MEEIGENVDVNKFTFVELVCALGGVDVPLKFAVRQGEVRLGVDRGGTLLVSRK